MLPLLCGVATLGRDVRPDGEINTAAVAVRLHLQEYPLVILLGEPPRLEERHLRPAVLAPDRPGPEIGNRRPRHPPRVPGVGKILRGELLVELVYIRKTVAVPWKQSRRFRLVRLGSPWVRRLELGVGRVVVRQRFLHLPQQPGAPGAHMPRQVRPGYTDAILLETLKEILLCRSLLTLGTFCSADQMRVDAVELLHEPLIPENELR